MAANTSPDNITYPVSTDAVASLETVFAALAASVQTALTRNAYSQYGTLAALQAVTGTRYGQHATVYADSTSAFNTDYYWTGTAWAFVVPIVSAGQVSVVLASAGSSTAAITFPTGRFTVAPLVQVTLQNAPGGTQKLVGRAYNVTATGATVAAYTGDGTATSATAVYVWHAIQMTPTTAAG